MSDDALERLHKVLAHAGIASRRKAETMIQEGRVTVNGQVVTELGTKVDPARDDIRVDGERVKEAAGHTYLLLNKPRGVLSVMEDDRGRRSLGDLVQHSGRLYPVGRLDVNSEGLVLLTDDGELANVLTHPRYGHEKEYRVAVNGHPSEKTLDAWRRGVVLEGERTAPAEVEIVRRDREGALLRVVMHEGRKRQIRDVAALLGHPVRDLRRVRIGPLELGNLDSGQVRPLTPAEVQAVRALVRGPLRKGRKGQGARAGYPPRAVGHGRTSEEIERQRPRERVRGQRPPARAGQAAAPPDRDERGHAPARARRAGPARKSWPGTPRDRDERERPPERTGRGAPPWGGRAGGPPGRDEREGRPGKAGRGRPPRRDRPGAPPDRDERGRPPAGAGRGAPPRSGRSGAPPDRDERGRPPAGARRGAPPRSGRSGGLPDRDERERPPAGAGRGRPPRSGGRAGRSDRDERSRAPERAGRGGPSRGGREGGPPDRDVGDHGRSGGKSRSGPDESRGPSRPAKGRRKGPPAKVRRREPRE